MNQFGYSEATLPFLAIAVCNSLDTPDLKINMYKLGIERFDLIEEKFQPRGIVTFMDKRHRITGTMDLVKGELNIDKCWLPKEKGK